jgi:hypothetical protein
MNRERLLQATGCRRPLLGAVVGHITDLEATVGRRVNRSMRL